MSESRRIMKVESQALAEVGQNPLVPGQERVDFSGAVSLFRRRQKIILAFLALSMVTGLLVTFLSDKTYTADATVILTNDADDAARTGATQAGKSAISSELVDTQAEIITSRDMVERVAKALELGVGANAQDWRRLIDTMHKNVKARRTGESYAIEISYETTDPSQAALVVNEFARQFTGWELAADRERNAQSRKLVESRLVELRSQAQGDLRALQNYRVANNLLSTSGASLTEQEISNYNQEVSRARAESVEDAARLSTALAQLRSGSTGDDVGEALGSSVISSLRSREAELAAEVALLQTRYGPNHPQLIGAKDQLGEIRGQIQSEIGRVISNLRAKQEVSAQRLGSLEGSLGLARSNLAQNNVAMVGLTDLERAAEASKGIYETYLNSYKQLLAAEGTERSHARILTLAEVPLLPSSPDVALNLALAAVIGLGLGIVAAYVMDSVSHGLRSAEDVQNALGERFLGAIPLLESVSESSSHEIAVVRDEPRSAFVESFKALRTSIDQIATSSNQVIAVTSALPREGKTIISCCLAHVLADSGQRTMLIDCDLRRFGVSRLLKMGPDQPGLIEVLSGVTPLNLDHMEGDNVFCVLPIRPSTDEPEHLLTGRPFIDLLAQLRQNFDRIILDLPPVLPIAATRVIACRADATVMVAHWNKTPVRAIRSALNRLPHDQVNVVGVALSQVDMRRRGFFTEDDPSYYYKKYREYYA